MDRTFPTTNSTSTTTIEKLRATFATHGIPEIIVSDNGKSFVSGEFEHFMKQNKIRHVTSAPYHPSTNGAAERTVQTFKSAMIKMTLSSSDSIATKVNRFLFTYRITPHSATGVSPAELLMNHKLNSSLSIIKPNINRKLRLNNEILIHNTSLRSKSNIQDRWFSLGSFLQQPREVGGRWSHPANRPCVVWSFYRPWSSAQTSRSNHKKSRYNREHILPSATYHHRTTNSQDCTTPDSGSSGHQWDPNWTGWSSGGSTRQPSIDQTEPGGGGETPATITRPVRQRRVLEKFKDYDLGLLFKLEGE